MHKKIDDLLIFTLYERVIPYKNEARTTTSKVDDLCTGMSIGRKLCMLQVPFIC
jgi:hypothetical protein